MKVSLGGWALLFSAVIFDVVVYVGHLKRSDVLYSLLFRYDIPILLNLPPDYVAANDETETSE